MSIALSDLASYVGAFIPIAVSAFVYLLTFAFTMGNSAYYRIPTQYGIASLPMAICQIIVALFAIILSLLGIAALGITVIAVCLLLVAFSFGIKVLAELRSEASTIERGAIAIGVVLLLLAIFANINSFGAPLLGLEVILFGLRFTVVGVISLAVALVVVFFEAGYIAAKCKRFYLVDPETREILLAEYSGDRFFFGYLGSVKRGEGNEAPVGYLTGECRFSGGKDTEGKFIWCEFSKVVMKRSSERLESLSDDAKGNH